jgi:drug/metabolite transporter (DMT)-like permease
MPDALIPPSIAVVVLGLGASLGWGLADFGGGVTSRQAPLLGVLAISQLLGVLIAVPLALARGEPGLGAADAGWALVGAVFGAVGLGLLYHGLAVGRMGVVAPVAGVLVAAIPVSAGIVLEGAPSGLILIGIGLAIASVVVVSRTPGEAGERTSGFWWGLGAGVAFGGLTIALSRIGDGLVFGPLALMRAAEAVLFTLAIAAGRGPWRVPRRLWPAMLAIGALDMTATASYIAATQSGPLAIAGTLSALYPVVTVILAATLLRERVTRVHLVGIALAGIAIVLIAGGASAA